MTRPLLLLPLLLLPSCAEESTRCDANFDCSPGEMCSDGQCLLREAPVLDDVPAPRMDNGLPVGEAPYEEVFAAGTPTFNGNIGYTAHDGVTDFYGSSYGTQVQLQLVVPERVSTFIAIDLPRAWLETEGEIDFGAAIAEDWSVGYMNACNYDDADRLYDEPLDDVRIIVGPPDEEGVAIVDIIVDGVETDGQATLPWQQAIID